MKNNLRLVMVVSVIGLQFFALITWIVSKFMVFNLQVSQKYVEIDLASDIDNAEWMGQISGVFLLILTVILIGVFVTSKVRK